jgi:hypothetical protein
MKAWLAIIISSVLVACVYNQKYPTEWGEKRLVDVSGMYSNKGIVDKESAELGHPAYSLHSIFWEKPSFEAEVIQLNQQGKTIEVIALKSNRQVASITLNMSEDEYTIKRSGSQDGAIYSETYRFWRTDGGLVVEADSIGLTVFIVPVVGSEKIWMYYKAFQ